MQLERARVKLGAETRDVQGGDSDVDFGASAFGIDSIFDLGDAGVHEEIPRVRQEVGGVLRAVEEALVQRRS